MSDYFGSYFGSSDGTSTLPPEIAAIVPLRPTISDWPPVLDIRDEEQLAATAIAYTSGLLTVERIDKQAEILRRLRTLVAAGTVIQAICPELTNANYSSPHTALLETQSLIVAEAVRLLNGLPEKIAIEFAALFGITPRAATKATTTFQFTVAPPVGVSVTIPAGTRVSTSDGSYVFTTLAEKVIPYGSSDRSVAAERTVTGQTLLAPATLVSINDPVAWVTAATNPDTIDSGSEAETISSALERARVYQRAGERLVSAQDIEDEILYNVLYGNGIVKAFPLIRDGDFVTNQAGHTTVVVMTRSGTAFDSATKARLNTSLQKLIGNQFLYIKDPTFQTFNVTANVRLTGIAPQSIILANIEQGLRNFYAATAGNFGRSILRSEIITIIEGTPGVDRIIAQSGGAILAQPVADEIVAPYEIPKLVNVTLTVVP